MSALIATTIRLAGPRPASATAATVARLHALLQQFLIVHHKCKSTGVDAIDSFTNELVDRKTTKWKSLKHKLATNQATFNTIGQLTGTADAVPAASAALDDSTPAVHISLRITARRILRDLHGDTQTNVRHCLNVQTLSVQHIDQLLQSARLDAEQPAEFFVILDECLRWRKLPGDTVIVDCLHHLTAVEQSNSPAAVHYADQLIDMCAAEHPALCAEHAQFAHFRARCRWHRGEHTQALQELAATYGAMRHGQLVRMADALRSILCEVADCAIRRTDADDADEQVLAAVERTAQQLSDRFGENQMLMFLWRSCFESDLFRHQQRAVRMFDSSEEVRAFVGQKTSLMCYTLLQEHKVELVYRLIELLLKFDMRNDCRTCLSFLFDYQYWRRDLRACSEIMRSSLDMDAPLSEAHNEKLLNLLLGTAPVPRKKPAPRSTQPKFELQF